jgi:hypothetical protein
MFVGLYDHAEPVAVLLATGALWEPETVDVTPKHGATPSRPRPTARAYRSTAPRSSNPLPIAPDLDL